MLKILTLTITLGRKPLTLTHIYRSHIHLHLTHPHNTFFLYYFFPTLQTQTLCHISFSILSQLHNMSSYNGQTIKTDEEYTFQCPHLMFFSNKASLENKNQPKALTLTTGPSIQYFILIPTSSRARNAHV